MTASPEQCQSARPRARLPSEMVRCASVPHRYLQIRQTLLVVGDAAFITLPSVKSEVGLRYREEAAPDITGESNGRTQRASGTIRHTRGLARRSGTHSGLSEHPSRSTSHSDAFRADPVIPARVVRLAAQQ